MPARCLCPRSPGRRAAARTLLDVPGEMAPAPTALAPWALGRLASWHPAHLRGGAWGPHSPQEAGWLQTELPSGPPGPPPWAGGRPCGRPPWRMSPGEGHPASITPAAHLQLQDPEFQQLVLVSPVLDLVF